MNLAKNHDRYVAGVRDGFLGRDHDDGKCPRHRLIVFVPLDDKYRLGFLDGMALRTKEKRLWPALQRLPEPNLTT